MCKALLDGPLNNRRPFFFFGQFDLRMSAIFHMELHEDGAEHGRTPSAALDGSIRNRLDSADDFEDDNVDDDEFDEDLFIHADVPSDDDDEDGGDGVQAEEIVIGDVGFDSAEPFAPKVGSQDFQILSLIGKGAYGKVFLVRKITGKDRGELFAMKVLRKASLVVLSASCKLAPGY